MLAAQNGTCAICANHSVENNGPVTDGKRSLCLDHDHLTGKVRGFLCGRCNKALGLFNDSPVRLSEAERYLLGHSDFDWSHFI